MSLKNIHPRPLTGFAISCLVLLAGFMSVSTQAGEGTLRFSKKLLLVSPNEGCAMGDVNKDGKLDIIAGTHWFAAPDFAARPLRNIEEFRDDYLRNNGDHVYDVNGDGWLDVISGEWLGDEIYWYENPGKVGLQKGIRWKPHLLKKTRGQNEAFFLRDLNADNVPEIVVDCWLADAPLVVWRLAQTDNNETTIERFVLGEKGCGHGMAFGDINRDGREDILTQVGWYEHPSKDALKTPWTLHPDWNRPDGSCPFLVVDLNGDGRNDLIWGDGHDYGLFWLEQLAPAEDGGTRWKEHLIDRSYSQTHCLHWTDLDGDGSSELITGKRVRGHAGRDPGGLEPSCLYYYEWDKPSGTFERHAISVDEGVSTGMQIRTADLNEDGRLDIAVSGKTGTWVLFNQGR